MLFGYLRSGKQVRAVFKVFELFLANALMGSAACKFWLVVHNALHILLKQLIIEFLNSVFFVRETRLFLKSVFEQSQTVSNYIISLNLPQHLFFCREGPGKQNLRYLLHWEDHICSSYAQINVYAVGCGFRSGKLWLNFGLNSKKGTS